MKDKHEPGYWTLERCKEKIAECGGDIILIKSKYPTLATRVYRGAYKDELKPLIKNGGKVAWTEERLLVAMKEADFNWTDLYRKHRGAWDCLSRVRRSMEYAANRKQTTKKPCGRKPRPDFSHLVAMMHRKDEVVIPSHEECLAALEAAEYKTGCIEPHFKAAIKRHYPDLKELATNKRQEAVIARNRERIEERHRKEREREERKRQAEERKRKKQEEKEQNKARRAAERKERREAYLRGEINLSSRIVYTEEYMREKIAECNYDLSEFRRKHRRGHTLLYGRFHYLIDLFPNRIKHPKRDKSKEPTLEETIERAKKYNSKKELDSADHELVLLIRRRGWDTIVTEQCGWRCSQRKGYHEARALMRAAKDYDEFVDKYPKVYAYILSVKSLRRALVGHFNRILFQKQHSKTSLRVQQEGMKGYRATLNGEDISRLIYACEFPDGYAYVGLTCNPARRKKEHGYLSKRSESSVSFHKWETGLDFEFKLLTEFMPELDAVLAEEVWERQYEEEGWKILNRAPTGGLGSSGNADREWNDEAAEELLVDVPDNAESCAEDFDYSGISSQKELVRIVKCVNSCEVERVVGLKAARFHHFSKNVSQDFARRKVVPTLTALSAHLCSLHFEFSEDAASIHDNMYAIVKTLSQRYLKSILGCSGYEYLQNLRKQIKDKKVRVDKMRNFYDMLMMAVVGIEKLINTAINKLENKINN